MVYGRTLDTIWAFRRDPTGRRQKSPRTKAAIKAQSVYRGEKARKTVRKTAKAKARNTLVRSAVFKTLPANIFRLIQNKTVPKGSKRKSPKKTVKK